jgi:hypothetical protein
VRAGSVVLISTITHGVFVALVADWTTPPATRPRPAPVRPAAVDAAPMEVALIEPAAVVIVAPPEPASTRRGRHASAASVGASASAQAVAVTGTVTGVESGTGTGTATGTGPETATGLFKMRGADLSLDSATAERIAASGAAGPRDELKKSGKLENRPGGGGMIHDRVTTVTVDPDGTAHLDDVPDIDVKFRVPIPKIWEVENMRKELGHQLTEWFKDPEAGKRFGRTQDLPRHLQASPGACDGWGNTMCDDPLAPKIEQLVRDRKKVLGGFFGGATDITAYLHRKFVGDPYASRKLKLLDDTRDERVAMGTAFRAEQAARSAELMQRNIDALWAREPSVVARRAALFEIVIGWIRAKLPKGSADAYTDEEIDALQAQRTSSTAFTPY